MLWNVEQSANYIRDTAKAIRIQREQIIELAALHGSKLPEDVQEIARRLNPTGSSLIDEPLKTIAAFSAEPKPVVKYKLPGR